MAQEMTSLEERIAALESALAQATGELERLKAGHRRAVHSNRLAVGVLTAGLATAVLGAAHGGFLTGMQAPQPLTVRAPFTVVDDAGREIVLVSTEQGARGLAVYNDFEKGQVVFLGRDQNNFAGVQVSNRAGSPVAILGQQTNGDPGLYVANAAGEVVAMVSTSRDEGGLVPAENPSHSEQIQLKVNDDAAGFMYIKAGKPVINLGRAEKGNMALRVRANDQIVAGIGDAADGSGGAMLLRDPTGAVAVKAAIASGQGGQVVVYGSGGGQAGIATKGSTGSAFAGPIETPVAKMGQSEATAGAGALDLEAPGGGSAVQAGFSAGGGIVETYTPGKPVGILKAGIKIPGFTAGSNQ